MLVDRIGQGEDPELMMCKLASVKSASCEPITIKEKAKFALDVHLRKLDLRIRDLEGKVEKCHEEVKQRLKQNSK